MYPRRSASAQSAIPTATVAVMMVSFSLFWRNSIALSAMLMGLDALQKGERIEIGRVAPVLRLLVGTKREMPKLKGILN
jgi:uncharacterized membrane protein